MKSFFRATIVGGVLFLLPAVLIALILGYAMRMIVRIAQPLSDGLGLEPPLFWEYWCWSSFHLQPAS